MRLVGMMFCAATSRASPPSCNTCRLTIETLIEAVRGDKALLAEESADLLYHLLVLWADQDVKPEAIWEALAKRRETSEMVEETKPK